MIRLIVLYDVPNWAFHNRALALQKYAPKDFHVQIMPWPQVRLLPPHDVVFQIDSSNLTRWSDKPHVFSWNSDHQRRVDRLHKLQACADYVIMNNRAAWEANGKKPKTCCIANGVDIEHFRVIRPMKTRPERIFWTGSDNPKKKKGLEILMKAKPALDRLGFFCDFHPVSDASRAPFTRDTIVDAYNLAAYHVCVSETEATPNTTLEAMACGCVPISTRVGNLLEMGVDTSNCWLIDRSAESLVNVMDKARRHREAVSDNAVRTMKAWSYGPPGNRAAMFFSVFRAIASRRVPAPFSYDSVWPEQI